MAQSLTKDSTQTFFEELAKRGREPLLHEVEGTIRFDLSDSAGNWHVWHLTIDHGKMTVSNGLDDADCVLTCSLEDFDRVIQGKQNLVTALMQGRVQLTGDIFLAQMFTRLLP
jgi:putative sterol carrier protein